MDSNNLPGTMPERATSVEGTRCILNEWWSKVASIPSLRRDLLGCCLVFFFLIHMLSVNVHGHGKDLQEMVSLITELLD